MWRGIRRFNRAKCGGVGQFARWCLVLWLAALGCAGAAGDELPTADALRAKIAVAAGTPLPASVTQRHETSAGLSGTQTIYRSGDDFREVDLEGSFHSEEGRLEKQSWYQNANGQTVLNEPPPGNEAAEGAVTTVKRVAKPVDAFLISTLTPSGIGTRDYVDPMTNHLIRREIVRPASTTTFSYDDFRTTNGYTSAWHWTRTDGRRANDGEFWVDAVTARAVTAAELAIPDPRRALIEFPADEKSVELPVDLVNDQFVVHVTVNGRKLNFILDTGAAGIMIDDDIARSLGLKPLQTMTNGENAGAIQESATIIPALDVGPLKMHDVVAFTITAMNQHLGGNRISGLLGFDFIAELALGLDYKNGRVTALSGARAHLTAGPGAYALDVRVGNGAPYTDVTINGALGEHFIIDTGASLALNVTDYFARLHPKALVDEGGGGHERDMQFSGAGGDINVSPYQLADVALGKLHFKDFVAFRMTSRKQYGGVFDGMIGSQVLRYFTVWLDYDHSQVILIENSNARGH